ncbi:MBL fold metallo-hydrolase [Rhodoferax koreense]|uniref:MBL fold metallo-hydrolase n=1 Tax=Rhodoferax koreensis TaxID=1842727 RepID=A0A1P8JT49_9BURK|nr:MBL fold metallo-hydrolase [Rhodoferax koreense]APW36927.1 MBL fold metallo-hydrolase [Rhodoferax koreense]
MTNPSSLPAGVTVLERGWLSANNILVQGRSGAALVDSGYCTHAPQTVALVAHALGGRPLDLLLNTHLHSDHCGGNAALQAAYPAMQTHIPPGQAAFVADWNPEALSYTPTGQNCPRFHFEAVLQPGNEIRLGDLAWQVHAAPGHDHHSVILFEPASKLLLSADALWEAGFGVVFPELDGIAAMDEVAATLDLIERLAPATVVPGHGKVFTDVQRSLAFARKRLEGFIGDPKKHANHAAKVLLKFKLLELQRVEYAALQCWVAETPYLQTLRRRFFDDAPAESWLHGLLLELVRVGAVRREADWVVDA